MATPLSLAMATLATNLGLAHTGLKMAEQVKKEKKKPVPAKLKKHRKKALKTYGFHLNLG